MNSKDFGIEYVNFNTPTLYVTIGLPGSGKSYLAKQMVDKSKGFLKQVNRDSLRTMIDNYDYSKKFNIKNEKFVTLVRDEMIKSGLEQGFSVICSDTNLSKTVQNHLRQIASNLKVEFEIIDFTDVSLETCIKQDLHRLDSVGKDVILKMYYAIFSPRTMLYISKMLQMLTY